MIATHVAPSGESLSTITAVLAMPDVLCGPCELAMATSLRF